MLYNHTLSILQSNHFNACVYRHYRSAKNDHGVYREEKVVTEVFIIFLIQDVIFIFFLFRILTVQFSPALLKNKER